MNETLTERSPCVNVPWDQRPPDFMTIEEYVRSIARLYPPDQEFDESSWLSETFYLHSLCINQNVQIVSATIATKCEVREVSAYPIELLKEYFDELE